MLKGTQKKMIVVEGNTGSMFETVYFVLKRDAEESGRYREKDMISEANRIINENSIEPSLRRKRISTKMAAIFSFLLGTLTGATFLILWNCFA